MDEETKTSFANLDKRLHAIEQRLPPKGCLNSCLSGCFSSLPHTAVYGIVGIFALLGTIRFGPLDFARTLYNTATGDVPALRQQLSTYSSQPTEHQSLEELWDNAEENSTHWYDRWVWTRQH